MREKEGRMKGGRWRDERREGRERRWKGEEEVSRGEGVRKEEEERGGKQNGGKGVEGGIEGCRRGGKRKNAERRERRGGRKKNVVRSKRKGGEEDGRKGSEWWVVQGRRKRRGGKEGGRGKGSARKGRGLHYFSFQRLFHTTSL